MIGSSLEKCWAEKRPSPMDLMSPLSSVYVMSDCFTYRRRDHSDVVLGLNQISYSICGIGDGIIRHRVPGSMVCSSLIDRAFFV